MRFVLLAACLWGTTGTAQAFAPTGAGPAGVGAARIILGGLLLLCVAGRGDALTRLVAAGRNTCGLLILGACCVAVYQTAFFSAVSMTGVATGTVVTIGSGPVFAGLLARVTTRDRLSRRWVASTVGAVAGCAVLLSGGQATGVMPGGVALALLSGLGYASYATIAAHLIRQGHDHRAVLAALFAGAAGLLVPVLFWSGVSWLLTGPGLLLTAYLGAVTTTLGYLWYGRGLRTTPAAVATTLTLAEPAVAAILGFTVLDEALDGSAVAGLGLLASSLLLLVVPAARRPAPDADRSCVDQPGANGPGVECR